MADKIGVLLSGSEGKMGKVLQRLISEAPDIEVSALVDPLYEGMEELEAKPVRSSTVSKVAIIYSEPDVYVDFTTPDAVVENIKAIPFGMDCVIGTTGWYDHIGEVEKIAKKDGRRMVFAPNFSIGVNALFAATEYLAKILGELGYDAAVTELHHTGKRDSPSGTAIQLGKILADKIPGKTKTATTRTNARAPEEIDVLGGRVGSVVGHHRVHFVPNGNYCERIILEHDAFNRDVFGLGALEAVRWVYKSAQGGKQPGLYTFRHDVLGL